MADETTPAPLSDAAGDAMAMLMPYQGAWVPVTVRDMLRERDARLAALEHDNAALREIVAAVAGLDRMEVEDGQCPFCGLRDWDDRDAPHLDRFGVCPVTRARALLATQTPATGAMAGEEGKA